MNENTPILLKTSKGFGRKNEMCFYMPVQVAEQVTQDERLSQKGPCPPPAAVQCIGQDRSEGGF